MDLVSAELPAKTLVVAIDPGKVTNRVLLANGEQGLIGEPVSLPTQREGIERLCELGLGLGQGLRFAVYSETGADPIQRESFGA